MRLEGTVAPQSNPSAIPSTNPPSENTPTPVPKKKGTKKVPIIVAAVLIAVVIIVAIGYSLMNKDSDGSNNTDDTVLITSSTSDMLLSADDLGNGWTQSNTWDASDLLLSFDCVDADGAIYAHSDSKTTYELGIYIIEFKTMSESSSAYDKTVNEVNQNITQTEDTYDVDVHTASINFGSEGKAYYFEVNDQYCASIIVRYNNVVFFISGVDDKYSDLVSIAEMQYDQIVENS